MAPVRQSAAVDQDERVQRMTAGELQEAFTALERTFHGDPAPESRVAETAVVDTDRMLVVRDGSDVVATAGSFALSMTLPGGPAPVAGVTWVGVQADRRRQGLLGAMMRRLLTDLHEAGEPIAALFASEGAIYHRYGFGPAAWSARLRVPRGAALVQPAAAGPVRQLLAPTGADLAPVYDAVHPTRTGTYARDDAWWAHRLVDPQDSRDGAGALRTLLVDGPAGPEAYALFAVKPVWEHDAAAGTVLVREAVATTPHAYSQLWRALLDVDLTTAVELRTGSVDEPLLQLLAEPRSARATLRDSLWTRLVDVGSALTQRSYAADVDVVLEVTDATCPWNAGRWRLSAAAAGAACTRTQDAGDLSLDVRDLGAVLLGGTSLASRAAAGTVTARSDAALARATTAFGWPGRAPWCPHVF